MITVAASTNNEVEDFGKKEWPKADLEHYGRPVDYKQQEIVYKAVENGIIVGSVKARTEAGVLYIDYLIVAGDQRSRGIGKQLTEAMEGWGRDMGAHKAHLITGKDWKAAGFYEKLGYKPIAVLPDHHFHQDFVVYGKNL